MSTQAVSRPYSNLNDDRRAYFFKLFASDHMRRLIEDALAHLPQRA
jgi:hypothetical protein